MLAGHDFSGHTQSSIYSSVCSYLPYHSIVMLFLIKLTPKGLKLSLCLGGSWTLLFKMQPKGEFSGADPKTSREHPSQDNAGLLILKQVSGCCVSLSGSTVDFSSGPEFLFSRPV